MRLKRSIIMSFSVRKDLKLIFETSVNAVKPDSLIRNYIKITDNKLIVKNDSQEMEKRFALKNREIYILGAGKAVLKMCEEFLKQLDSNELKIKSGLLSVPIGSQTDDQLFAKYNVQYKCGALNNMPDIDSQTNTEQIVNLIKNAKSSVKSSDSNEIPLIISFISGGGSALLSLPKPDVKLEEKCLLIRKLVKSGATITELNCVRRCLSQVKCGKLAKLALSKPNSIQLISFIISDIIDDPIELIASGPTVISKSDKEMPSEKAFFILKKFNIQVDENIRKTIKSEDSQLSFDESNGRLTNIVIGNNTIALNVAKNTANKLGYKVFYLGNRINGEANDVAKQWAQIAINYKETEEERNQFKGICWVAGGETTVNMNNSQIGLGGRCQQMGLAFYRTVYNLESDQKLYLMCVGTDGQDGPTSVAGVIVENISKSDDLNGEIFKQSNNDLNNFNSHNFFKDNYNNWLIDTKGVTGTNVMDIYCMIKYFNKLQ